jgi:cell wall-associated NlpC family hydrolase
MASAGRSVRRFFRRVLIAGVVLAVVVLAAAVTATALPGADPAAAGAAPAPAPMVDSGPEPALPSAHPRAVEPEAGVPAGEQPADPSSSATTSTSASQSPSDDEIRRELAQLKDLAGRAQVPVGDTGRVLADGTAVAPKDAPQIVRDVINTGNVIAKTPYLWGGGHGSWAASGYDCSGSVSFALAGAGLLDSPLTSGLLARWGSAGPGRWITIYANGGHVFMEVAGLRFDTGGIRGSGTRWQTTGRGTAGFVARHPEGL